MQLPVDHLVAQKLDAEAPTRVVDGISTPIPGDFLGVDIGPETV